MANLFFEDNSLCTNKNPIFAHNQVNKDTQQQSKTARKGKPVTSR